MSTEENQQMIDTYYKSLNLRSRIVESMKTEMRQLADKLYKLDDFLWETGWAPLPQSYKDTFQKMKANVSIIAEIIIVKTG